MMCTAPGKQRLPWFSNRARAPVMATGTTGAPVVPVAITGARALFENHGNRCFPGAVHIKVLPPIQTVGMSRAEQKQLPDAVRQTILAEL